jgi:hypothetical protein
LLGQSDGQKALAEDARNLAENKLKDAKIFDHMLRKSAAAMEQAADSIKDRVKKGDERADGKLDAAGQEAAYQRTHRLQTEALRYLEQLLAVLKDEEDRMRQGGGAGGGNGGAGGGGRESDGIPELAQFKLLKTLQQDVAKRTEEFARKHPDLKKLTEAQKKELAGIHKDQAEITKLLDDLTAREGDKP